MLAEELRLKVEQQRRFEQSKQIALGLLDQGFSLGGRGIEDREALHDRANLR
jgi:hypothetical protein